MEEKLHAVDLIADINLCRWATRIPGAKDYNFFGKKEN